MMNRDAQAILIEVVYALPKKQQLIKISVPSGTCARDALNIVIEQNLLTLTSDDAALAPDRLPIGVYGQSVDDDYRLKNGDRLEIYRPLLQDPKERRRKIAGQRQRRGQS